MAERPIDPYWTLLIGDQIFTIFTPTSDIMYHPEINSRSDLASVDTKLIPVGTVYLFNSGVGANRIFVAAELQSGPANVSDTSEVAPNNYSLTLNNKHWQVTGGLLV